MDRWTVHPTGCIAAPVAFVSALLGVACDDGGDTAEPARDRGSATTNGEGRRHAFDDGIDVSFSDTHLVVRCDSVPDHEVGDFPNGDNPNAIAAQDHEWRIPLEPRRADAPTATALGRAPDVGAVTVRA